MKRYYLTALLLWAILSVAYSQASFTKSETLRVIDKVNAYWQQNNPKHGRSFWDNAAYHTGNMEVYFLTGNENYLRYTEEWAKHNEWKGAKSNNKNEWKYSYGETDEYVLFGDYQICFQNYADLYMLSPDPKKIARAREVMEYQMSTDRNDYWWWSDGLYMVMPVMTKLYKITGNDLYLKKLHEYLMYSDSIMYDSEAALYYRDARYVYPKHQTVNGKKDFWARGVGWVFAGFAKVLKDLPQSAIHRSAYVKRFQDMAKAIAASQQPGGYWTRSMLDPTFAPGPETSGTAFFTYGFLWGINNGLLDKETYGPVALKGWEYLVNTALQENGRIGYVQPIGDRAIPGQVIDANSTANFGVGAFLLAACEMVRYAPESPVLQNVYARHTFSLNGSWRAIVDPFDNGFYDYRLKENPNGFFKNQKMRDKSDLVEYNFDTAQQLMVPGDWNTQNDKLFFYEGSVWYKKDFTYNKKADTRVYLYFGAVNYLANVYLNGEKVGVHEGGFTPFYFDVTDKLREGDNFVVLRVNNERKPEGVPTVNSDWWNYGGITRDVLLVETPEVSVDDYLVQLPKGKYNEITGYVKLSKPVPGVKIQIRIPELKITQTLTTDEQGKAAFACKAKPQLWSPENPKLYAVEVRNGAEVLEDKIGFRQIETKGKSLLLNGKQTFLRGISIHEEAPYRQGRVYSKEESLLLLNWAKELGCNFVRLAHYPHNEHMVRAAEEMGLMVWSEIPVYWTIHWDNPDTYHNASAQLNDMMERDKNRCSVIIWSVANETPHSDARDNFLARLAKQVRNKDNTRLLSMAMEVTGTKNNISQVKDYMSEYVDIISFNNYLGWYGGTPEDCKTRQWDIPYDKPFFISEFGGGALQGLHGDKTERWTEEYQEELYKNTLDMYNRVDGFAGTSPWILMDFRSTRRQLNGIQDFFNRKGVISERGVRKKAFYVLQDFYRSKKAEYEQKSKK